VEAQADLIIEPDVHPFAWDDFSKTPELVKAGEEATLESATGDPRAGERREKKDSAA